MHVAAFSPRGGVSPRSTCLRGQSIIEYVLIIAFIGLVIVFGGPGVAGSIRNQFNLVGNTVNSGTNGGTEGGAAGGGSTGVDSAVVQAAVAKDAKDWTLDEQKAVAEDIAAKGEASPAYAKAEAAMDAGTKWSVKLTDGKTLEYRIIGINHDDLADGSGKAGLTFLSSPTYADWTLQASMNDRMTHAGGWEKSELRQSMNSGTIWNHMPSDLRANAKAVKKLTNNVGNVETANVSATTDKFFLLSFTELGRNGGNIPSWWPDWAWISAEGTQYEGIKRTNDINTGNTTWWERTLYPNTSKEPGDNGSFLCVKDYGHPTNRHGATESEYVCPAWCF